MVDCFNQYSYVFLSENQSNTLSIYDYMKKEWVIQNCKTDNNPFFMQYSFHPYKDYGIIY